MLHLTPEQEILILHLFKGGKVKHSDSQSATTIDSIVMDNDSTIAPAHLLEKYVEYFTPEEIQIAELKEQLRIQGEALQKALHPDGKAKRRAHITRGEVLDIERDLKSGADEALILKEYDISSNTLYRIKAHSHTHSTPIIKE